MIYTVFQYISNLPDKRVARAFRNVFDTLYPRAVAVTQATSRTTGVSVASQAGTITTNNASLAAEASADFVVTCPGVLVGDVPVVSIRSGANGGNTAVSVVAVAAGSFTVKVANHNAAAGTAETGAIVINFAVVKVQI